MTQYKPYTPTNIGWLKPIFRYRIAIIIGNWANQGFLYSDTTEKAFRIFIDVVFALPLYFLLINFTDGRGSLFFAILFAHTLNWIFNGHLFGLYRFINENPNAFKENTFEKNMRYLKRLQNRIEKEKSIGCAALYGSVSREEFDTRSDVDIRIIRKPGFINGLRACFFGFFERSRALFNKFPIDLYVVDNTKHLSKLRDDEIPVVLYDPEKIFEKIYKEINYFGRGCF